MALPKHTFTGRLRDAAQQLAAAATALKTLSAVYVDRGYPLAGTNPIADSDVVDHHVTAAEVQSMVQLADQLVTYLEQAARRELLSRFRNDV